MSETLVEIADRKDAKKNKKIVSEIYESPNEMAKEFREPLVLVIKFRSQYTVY